MVTVSGECGLLNINKCTILACTHTSAFRNAKHLPMPLSTGGFGVTLSAMVPQAAQPSGLCTAKNSFTGGGNGSGVGGATSRV